MGSSLVVYHWDVTPESSDLPRIAVGRKNGTDASFMTVTKYLTKKKRKRSKSAPASRADYAGGKMQKKSLRHMP
jgi:hypothetical protein